MRQDFEQDVQRFPWRSLRGQQERVQGKYGVAARHGR
jgi:hypothetical protein